MHKIKDFIKKVLWLLQVTRFIPHIIIFYAHPQREFLKKERNTWIKIIKNEDVFNLNNFLWLLIRVPEYRSVLYFRIGFISRFLKIFCPGKVNLFINIPSCNVGNGLVIQHGFSTIIEANTIGENCQIWHNVTIGTNVSHSGNKATIGDNVKICAGAIVIGNITIGNNVTIGAGAVIVKSVPDNCIVVGNPAFIIKQNGKATRIKL